MPDANYTADAVVLSELLSTASTPIEVPDWQRSYSWKSDQIEVFWADLLRFNRAYPGANIANQQYFLGSIVMVNVATKYLLLDGQQRIATATILLSVLREHRRPLSSEASQRLQTKYIADFDDGTQQTQYSVTSNRYDKEFFRRAVQAEGQTATVPKLRSHALIKKAQGYFQTELLALTDGLADEEALALNVRLQDVLLKHFSVVSVRSNDEDTASTVFEALNDRGIGLSTPDLLRSYLLRSAPGEAERESIVASWLEIFSLFEEANVEGFLRHYWVSLNGDVKTRSLYREIKAHFEANGVNPVSFSDELAAGATDYRALKDASDTSERVKRALEGINQLAATVLYPALMSALSIRQLVAEDEFESLVRDLQVLYVRYTLIGGKESTKLEAEVFSIAQAIRTECSLTSARARIRAFAPDLSEFVRGFETAIVPRAESAKYLLGELEMHLRATDELVLANGRKVQLEHIYPQSPIHGERLSSHSAVVNRIGNHTLLDHRLNASIKNGLFASKREDAYKASELHLTSALILHKGERWGEVEIAERQTWLAQQAAEVWTFDDAEYQSFLGHTRVPLEEATTNQTIESLPEDDEALVDS